MNVAIIEKVRKLRALAQSSNANEAAAAAAAADRLIQEYRLQEAELHAETPEEPTRGDPLYVETRKCRWRSSLSGAICRNYGVYAIHSWVAGKLELWIYGTPSDLELVRYMYAWLSSEAERLVTTSGMRGMRMRNSWFLGFVDGVSRQLAASKAASETVARASGHSTGIVHLASARDRARALALSGGIKPKSGGSSSARIDGDAFGAGRTAGANIHLGKGLNVRPARLLGTGS